MAESNTYVRTSLGGVIRTELEFNHLFRRIGIISGPPGIGKTTALGKFRDDRHGEVVIVAVSKPNRDKGHSPSQTIRMLLAALTDAGHHFSTPNSDALHVMQDQAERALAWWYSERLTIVFDEAQYLSQAAIETLRFWNDNPNKTFPDSVGLVFVGNDEFSMKVNSRGKSTISAAVRSRASRPLIFHRKDLHLDEIRSFIQAQSISDADAINELLAFVKVNEDRRDFRLLGNEIERCRLLAGEVPITREIVRFVLSRR